MAFTVIHEKKEPEHPQYTFVRAPRKNTGSSLFSKGKQQTGRSRKGTA